MVTVRAKIYLESLVIMLMNQVLVAIELEFRDLHTNLLIIERTIKNIEQCLNEIIHRLGSISA